MDANPTPEPPVIAEPQRLPTPWPFWPTVGFSLAIVAAGLAAQIMVVAIIVGVKVAMTGSMPDPKTLESDGMVLAFGTASMMPIVVGLVLFLAWLRKGLSVKEYLDLRWTDLKTAARWTAGLVGFIIISDSLTFLIGRPIVTPFMLEAYQTAGWALPVLWIALILAAPFSEEFFFRGFLFTGLLHTRLKTVGTAIVTSALWAIIHLQYDWYGILTIFVGGLFLAAVRVKTGSLWLCVFLHCTMNLIATLQTVIYLQFL